MNGRLIQPIVVCFLVNQSHVLMLKRSPDKKVYPSKWDGIGGKVEAGETPLHACIREFKEEAGAQILDPTLRGVFTLLDQQYGCEWIMFVFRATKYVGELLDQSSDGEFRWTPLSEINSMDVVPDLKLYLKSVVTLDQDIIFGHFNYDEKGNLSNYIL